MVEYIVDYTEKHKNGKLKNIVGREKDIERAIHIMLRKTKDNPVLIGPVGIGKKSIIEAVATKFAKNDVPKVLEGSKVVEVDVASILIDSKTTSEYEEKLKQCFKHLKESNGMDVLFIKDVKILNLKSEYSEIAKFLKPKIISGEIKCIIATDIQNYKLHIENDNELMRYMQPMYIEEPNIMDSLAVIKGVKDEYEKYFSIKISEECLKACVLLTDRYIKNKNFPEKAIDLLDEAVSLCNMEGKDNKLTLRHIGNIISMWTGIPLNKINTEDRKRLANMESIIGSRVIGQPDAVATICNTVRIAKSGLQDPNRPMGTFLFIGTTGVGKTELAKALAEFVFDDELALLRLDMSEYMERQSVSRLIGPPPGQPGYEEGGLLTEAVRLRPYQVILFDELEKANDEILNLFLQILDEGRLTDGKGVTADFRNTVIIMTSNLAADAPHYKRKEILKKHLRPEFLSRIDDIVAFNGLNLVDLTEIVDLHIKKLIKRAFEKGIKIVISDDGIEFLANHVYHAKNGVRELKGLMKKYIQSPLAEYMIRGEVNKGDMIRFSKKGNYGVMHIHKIDEEGKVLKDLTPEDNKPHPEDEEEKEFIDGEEVVEEIIEVAEGEELPDEEGVEYVEVKDPA